MKSRSLRFRKSHEYPLLDVVGVKHVCHHDMLSIHFDSGPCDQYERFISQLFSGNIIFSAGSRCLNVKQSVVFNKNKARFGKTCKGNFKIKA